MGYLHFARQENQQYQEAEAFLSQAYLISKNNGVAEFNLYLCKFYQVDTSIIPPLLQLYNRINEPIRKSYCLLLSFLTAVQIEKYSFALNLVEILVNMLKAGTINKYDLPRVPYHYYQMIKVFIALIILAIYLLIYLVKFMLYLAKKVRKKAASESDAELQLDIPDEEIRVMFPGGEDEINREVKKLRVLLHQSYPKDLVKLVLMATSVFYKQSGSKDKKVMVAYILKVSDNLISPQDAWIIYDFIYTKLLRKMLGPIVGESNLDMLHGMVKFKGRDDVEEAKEVTVEDKTAEVSIDYADSVGFLSNVPEEESEEIIKGIFPGGAAEIEKESNKLYALLQKAYPKALVNSLLVDGSVFFVQSDDKSEEKLIAHLKQIAITPIPIKDAKKIHDFIYTRGLRLALGKSENDVAFLNVYNDIDELTGCDADEIPGGSGPFGLTLENPVPIKGIISNDYYLARLRTEKGERITWERIGSRKAVNIKNPVDVYKIMDLEEAEICRIYISPYHRRVSNKAPAGFRLLFKSDLENVSPTFTPTSVSPPVGCTGPYAEKEFLEPAAIIRTEKDADGNEEVEVTDPRILMAATTIMTASATLIVSKREEANKHL